MTRRRMREYSPIRALMMLLCLLTLARPGSAQSSTLAGIPYDPAVPLQPQVTARKDAKGEPLPLFQVAFRGAGDATVPALLSLPTAPSPSRRPAVLLLHGMGGDKNQLQALALMLNGKGIVTLAIDAAGHGERPKLAGKPVAELNLMETRTLAAQTVQDLRRAVDYLGSRSDVDPKRIGFVGVSLGGILGARFLAEDPRVAAAVLWVAGGDWGTLITQSAHPWAKAFRARGETNPAAIREALREVDPAVAMPSAPARPMLFLNGDKDDVVPRACSDALIAATKSPKQAVLLPGGHVPNLLEMASQTIAFLTKNLK